MTGIKVYNGVTFKPGVLFKVPASAPTPTSRNNVQLKTNVRVLGAPAAIQLTTVESLMLIGVDTTISGTCSPPTNTVTVTINGVEFGTGVGVDGVWSITAAPTVSMSGADVTVSATVYGKSDTETVVVAYPLVFNNQSSLTQTNLQMNVSTGSMTIYWGDGYTTSVTCDGTLQSINYDYSQTGTYNVGVLGNIEEIIDFRALNESQVSGDIGWFANFTTLQQLYLTGTVFSGDISPLNDLASTITLIWASNTDISGDVGNLYQTTGLTQLLVGNTTVTYPDSASIAWTAIDLRVQDNMWDADTVDRFFIDLAAGGGINGTLYIGGNNDSRTAAATTAYNTLVSNGWTINE